VGGLVVDGALVEVPGRRVVNFLDDPRVRLELPEDGRRRRPKTWIRQIFIHTTRGIPGGEDLRPQQIRAGVGPATWPILNIAEMWRADDRYAGAHLVVDHDTTVYCMADIVREVTYHATTANLMSVGIELKQGGHAELYAEQLEAACDVIDVLTRELGIQRQIPHRYEGKPICRLDEEGRCKGHDTVGVFGHRDNTRDRGAGDPGDEIFDRLAVRRYARHDFCRRRDQIFWAEIQRMLGVVADGVPGPKTVEALKARGYGGGLWACPPAEFVALVEGSER
jgi:hypothetical protein